MLFGGGYVGTGTHNEFRHRARHLRYTRCVWAGGTTEFSRLILLFNCLIRKNRTSTSSMNYTILLVSHFIHNSLHNSFLLIFYITFRVRKLQLQILLTEKYPGLKPRNNHITTSSMNYTT